MSTAVGTNPVEDFIGQLREKYGVVDGIRIVPDDFSQNLGNLVNWAVMTLSHIQKHDAASKTLAAIGEYQKYLQGLKKPNYLSPPQPSSPYH